MIDGNIDVLSLEGQIVDSISLEGDLLPIGPKGDKGDPGFSPVITTSKSGKTTTVKFETATGNVYAYIQDGEDGQGSGDMLTDVYDKNKNGIVDDAEKVNGKTVLSNVPANAVFTDTVYDDTEVRGLINAKPDFSDIPTNVSELTNDANYVSSDGASTVSGENTALTLNGTTKGLFKTFDLKGNTSQNGTPTPDSSIPINNVSGNNEIQIEGKNLYNSSFRNNNNAIAFSRCTGSEKNGIYTITATASDMYFWYAQSSGRNYTKDCGPLFKFDENTYLLTITNPLFTNNYITYYDEDKVSLGFIGKNANSFTINKNDKENARYFSIRIGYGRATSGETYLTSVQLEKGSTATAYEAYDERTYSIDLDDIQLNKIGNYQDYIYNSGTKWYLHKEIDSIILDGSENWSAYGDTQTDVRGFYTPSSDTIYNIGLSNYFAKYDGDIGRSGRLNINYPAISILADFYKIAIPKTIANSVNELKDWLYSNDVYVYHAMATPTNTEITDTTLISQLNALYKAYTYKNQTNISQSNNDLPFILNVEAFTDTYNGRYENIINMIKKVQ